MDLTQLRKDIDEIDRQLVELYEQRMDICKRVAEYKIITISTRYCTRRIWQS